MSYSENVQSKMAVAFSTINRRTSMTIRPAGVPPISMSKKTRVVILSIQRGGMAGGSAQETDAKIFRNSTTGFEFSATPK